MDAPPDPPVLSVPQLFSFQVSYTSRSDYRNSLLPEGSKVRFSSTSDYYRNVMKYMIRERLVFESTSSLTVYLYKQKQNV